MSKVKLIPHKNYRPGPYAPRLFGCAYTSRERSQLDAAIREAAGIEWREFHMLVMQAMDAIELEYGVPNCYIWVDDAHVYIAAQFGVDYRTFPHNTPKRSSAGFLEFAMKELPKLQVAENDLQRSVRRKPLRTAWSKWVAIQCFHSNCLYEDHDRCEDLFEKVDFDEVGDLVALANKKPPGRRKKVTQPTGLRLVYSANV
jgi:hypothetical protein